MNLAEKQSAKKRKILIFSAPIGSGHRIAAQALEEALSRLEKWFRGMFLAFSLQCWAGFFCGVMKRF